MAGSLCFGTADVWRWINLCGGGCSARRRFLSSTPRLSPLHAHGTLSLVVTTTVSPDTGNGKITPS